jgi:hypothetical protein
MKPPRVPSHQALLVSVEAAIGRHSRALRAHSLRRERGVGMMDFSTNPDNYFAAHEELEWLFNDPEWQMHNQGLFRNGPREEGDHAYALVRLIELRDRLLATKPWPAREEV